MNGASSYVIFIASRVSGFTNLRSSTSVLHAMRRGEILVLPDTAQTI